MSRLNKLLGKGKEIDLGGEIILIKPLKLKDLDLFMDLANESKRTETTKKIIFQTIKEAVPDVTNEELENISVEYITTLLNEILEVNGLTQDKVPKSIVERYNVGSEKKT